MWRRAALEGVCAVPALPDGSRTAGSGTLGGSSRQGFAARGLSAFSIRPFRPESVFLCMEAVASVVLRQIYIFCNAQGGLFRSDPLLEE